MFQTYFLRKRPLPRTAPICGYVSAGRPLEAEPFLARRRMPIPVQLRRFGMAVFRVTGDSMTREDGSGLVDGAWVLVDTRDPLTHDGHLGAFQLDDGTMVTKRYGLHKGRPSMHSDNPAYEPLPLSAGIRRLGRVYAYSTDGRTWEKVGWKGWN